jgi:hypothetical protein
MSKLTYLPLADGKWRMSLGLKALNLKEWIEIDEHFADELRLKDKLLKTHYCDVFAALPESQPSQKEVLHLLINHLPEQFPHYYRSHDSRIENLITGQVWDISEFEAAPLDLAGRLVQEDLLIMQSRPEGYSLTAASLCFPLRWRLRDKIGRSLAQIHSPVPGYHDQLERRVDSFFDRLQPDCPTWRLNWSIVDSPELFFPPNKATQGFNTTINAENARDTLWLRVERQTLQRLKVSHDILFTIRTYVHPLHVLEDDPVTAHNLAEAIKQMPPEMQSYKNLLSVRKALLDYLDQICSRIDLGDPNLIFTDI